MIGCSLTDDMTLRPSVTRRSVMITMGVRYQGDKADKQVKYISRRFDKQTKQTADDRLHTDR